MLQKVYRNNVWIDFPSAILWNSIWLFCLSLYVTGLDRRVKVFTLFVGVLIFGPVWVNFSCVTPDDFTWGGGKRCFLRSSSDMKSVNQNNHNSVLMFSPSNVLHVKFLAADCSGPIYRSRGLSRRPADIPPIDPTVLVDLQRHTQEVAQSVETMMRSLNGTIQNVRAWPFVAKWTCPSIGRVEWSSSLCTSD